MHTTFLQSSLADQPEKTTVDEHPPPDEAPPEHEWDPLAQTIIERVVQNPQFLKSVPARIRAHKDWFRQIVLEVVDRNADAFFCLPEFFGDDSVRAEASLKTDVDPEAVRRFQRYYGYDPDVPENASKEGSPFKEARVSKRSLDNGNRRLGKCDVCQAERMIEGEVTLELQHVPTMRAQVCSCMIELFEQEDISPEQVLKVLYGNGSFVE